MLTLQAIGSYPIIIGEEAWASISEYISADVLVVSSQNIAQYYLDGLMHHLDGHRVVTCLLPDGERYKTQDSVNIIYQALLQARFGRDCTLVALGGGVVGDMVGFAAATFMRGVNFLQLPTTLLAQVDSSVGGKTGINHPLGKNMIGAFWQPKAVLADTATLASLPDNHFFAGMAEVIKYGCIMDKTFLWWLKEHALAITNKDSTILSQMIYRSCQYKSQIVTLDEREQGVRAHLNFGHTFGHAIETCMGYGAWLHGEAVAAGMVLAAKMSLLRGLITQDELDLLCELLTLFHLPTTPPAIPADDFISFMGYDKKAKQGRPRFVLLTALGAAQVFSDVTDAELYQVLGEKDEQNQ